MPRHSRTTTARHLAVAAVGLLTAVPGLLLLEPGAASAAPGEPAPATNGRIVFSDDRDGDREIFTINPDGSGLQQLTADPADGPDDTHPRWSPDGERIAFMRDYALYTMNADGTDLTRLSPEDVWVAPGQPAWSPDGTRIAYTRGDAIWVVGADGSDPHPVAVPENSAHRYEMPEWTPDGTRVAYLSRMGPGYAQIHSVELDGTDAEVVVDSYVFTPRWSRDGQWLAYEELGLTTVDPEGELDRIVFLNGSEEGDLEGLGWAPDGTRLVFAQRRHDGQVWTHPDVRVVSADGTGLQTLTPGWTPDWQPVLPDPEPEPVAPDTTITTTAPRWSLDQPSVGFTSDATGATFECRLDAGAWQACAAPYVPAWRPGSHALQVRATADGLTDATPAELRWSTPYDDRQLTGRRWKSVAGPSYYRSTARVSKANGATLARGAVRATEIALVATTCPGCGKVDVYYGKQRLKRVSLASSTTRHEVVIPVRRWSAAQPAQRVRVVVVTKGKRVVVDGLAVR